jgi:hypothetical protein
MEINHIDNVHNTPIVSHNSKSKLMSSSMSNDSKKNNKRSSPKSIHYQDNLESKQISMSPKSRGKYFKESNEQFQIDKFNKIVTLSPANYLLVKLNKPNPTDFKFEPKLSKHETVFSKKFPEDLLHISINKLNNLIKYLSDKPEDDKISSEQSKSLLFDNKIMHNFTEAKNKLKPFAQLSNKAPDGWITKPLLKTQFVHHIKTVDLFRLCYFFRMLPFKLGNQKILSISRNCAFAEVMAHRYGNSNSNSNSNGNSNNNYINGQLTTYLLEYACSDKDVAYNMVNSMASVYKYNNINIVDSFWTPHELEKIIQSESKKSLIHLEAGIFYNNTDKLRINGNHQLLLGLIIIGLSLLQHNGSLILEIPSLSSQTSQDIVFMISSMFHESNLYNSEVLEPHYNTVYLVANKFNGCDEKLLEQMKQLYRDYYVVDMSGGLNYTTNDTNVVKSYNIHSFEEKQPLALYINGLITNLENNTIYIEMNIFNKLKLERYCQFIENIKIYKDIIGFDTNNDKRYQLMQLYTCVGMAKYLKLDMNPEFDVKTLHTDLVNNIYRNLYGLDSTVHYMFQYSKQPIKMGIKLESSNQYLLEQVLRMDEVSRMFNNHIPESYNIFKNKLAEYENELNNLLVNEFNIGVPINKGNTKISLTPSRAWLKLYEILEITGIIPKLANEYSVLSLCDSSGDCVLALNHYIKTKTKIQKFNWAAQTYNSHSGEHIDKDNYSNIDDNYQLIKKYNHKWDFGPTDDGDITIPDNITYYGRVYKDMNLLIADCGNATTGDMVSSKFMYSQLLFILNNLPEGQDFIIKYYIPFIHYPAHLSLFYIIYQSFAEISFYKPLQNTWSHDFYLIGKNYRNKLNEKQLNLLFDILNDYNPYKTPVRSAYPKSFIKQLEKVIKDSVDRYVFYIHRYIYYLDLLENDKKPDMTIVKEQIHNRNAEWIKKFKITKINDVDKL